MVFFWTWTELLASQIVKKMNHGCTLFTLFSPRGDLKFGELKLQSAEGIAQPDSGQTNEDMEDDISEGLKNSAVF